MNDALREAVAEFVGACARFGLCGPGAREQRRLELHVAWDRLAAAWAENAP